MKIDYEVSNSINVKTLEIIKGTIRSKCYVDGNIKILEYEDVFNFIKEIKFYGFYNYKTDTLTISDDPFLLE